MRNIKHNLKYTSSVNLKAIIKDNYVGRDGFDYHDYSQVIDEILWARTEKKMKLATKVRLKSISEVHNSFLNQLAMLKAYHKTFGDSEGLRIEIKRNIKEYEDFSNAI